MSIRSTEVDPIYISDLRKEDHPSQINIKMINLSYKFKCGPTAREILTTITKNLCGECLVDSMCNVACTNYLDSYRWMVEWLNENEYRQVNGLEILDKLGEVIGDLE
jgi:hypothetical protein